jgi:hypothetical protein
VEFFWSVCGCFWWCKLRFHHEGEEWHSHVS